MAFLSEKQARFTQLAILTFCLLTGTACFNNKSISHNNNVKEGNSLYKKITSYNGKEEMTEFTIDDEINSLYTINIEVEFPEKNSIEQNILLEDQWEKSQDLQFDVSLWHIDGEIKERIVLSDIRKVKSNKLFDTYVVNRAESSAFQIVDHNKLWLTRYEISKFKHLKQKGFYQLKIIPLLNDKKLANVKFYFSIRKYNFPK